MTYAMIGEGEGEGRGGGKTEVSVRICAGDCVVGQCVSSVGSDSVK